MKYQVKVMMEMKQQLQQKQQEINQKTQKALHMKKH